MIRGSAFNDAGKLARFAAAFEKLEQKFGDLQSIRDKDAKVIVLEDGKLERTALEDLTQHRALAVHVKNFYPKDLAERMAETMLGDSDRMNWNVSNQTNQLQESEVEAIGIPHNVAVAQGKLDQYFHNSVKEIRKWRSPTSLQMGPMDKFRLEMDEVWPEGCLLGRDKKSGQPFCAGIPRIMKPFVKYDAKRWSRGYAHVDELAIMSPDQGLYSVNIYLQNAASGGELQIFPVTFTSRWDFYRNAFTLSLALLQDPTAQQILRSRLPEPVTIKPNAGDAVLLCTQRPHAVKGPILGGTRVSIQAFLQHEKGKPIKIES